MPLMLGLSYKEIMSILRESESDYLRDMKESVEHDSRSYSRYGIFITRDIRKKFKEYIAKKNNMG